MDGSIANLYSLFKHIGINSMLANYVETGKYSSIQALNSAWPNAIYNFSENILDNESGLENLRNAILDMNLPHLCMHHSDNINTNLLKKYGFYVIEQWKLMSLRLSENFSFENYLSANYEFGIVQSESDLDAWIETVRDSLFQKKVINRDIFMFLNSTGSELIYVRNGNETVGAAMVYYDENQTAGIYMVCINQDERGMGLGKKLVIFTLERIKKRKINNVVLQSTRAGFNLYLKMAFAVSGTCNLIYKMK